MLMSYVVDKFPENHSPTIYDKFSSEFSLFLINSVHTLKVLVCNLFPLFSAASITVNGRKISITMCDTAGQVCIAYIPIVEHLCICGKGVASRGPTEKTCLFLGLDC